MNVRSAGAKSWLFNELHYALRHARNHLDRRIRGCEKILDAITKIAHRAGSGPALCGVHYLRVASRRPKLKRLTDTIGIRQWPIRRYRVEFISDPQDDTAANG
jgi:hypothetical protein